MCRRRQDPMPAVIFACRWSSARLSSLGTCIVLCDLIVRPARAELRYSTLPKIRRRAGETDLRVCVDQGRPASICLSSADVSGGKTPVGCGFRPDGSGWQVIGRHSDGQPSSLHRCWRHFLICADRLEPSRSLAPARLPQQPRSAELRDGRGAGCALERWRGLPQNLNRAMISLITQFDCCIAVQAGTSAS